MKKKMTFLLCMIAAFLLSSCAVTGPRHYKCTEKDSGRTLHLDKGDTITITLDSNPTTGYLWKFGAPLYDERIVFLRGDKYIQPQEELCGAPGKRRLTFVAEGSGRTGIRIIYVRPWEKDVPPAKEFNLLVLVKDGTEDPDWDKPRTRRNLKGKVFPDRKRSVWD